MKSNEKTLIEQEIKPVETMSAQTWKRFRRHPGAMAGAVVLILIVLTALLVPLSPYDPEKSDIKNRFQAPSVAHPFGTDGLGRIS
jgi:peptide/nickel transport system permease protein